MDDRSIGVMDSGAGGFTVARAIRRLAPLENIVYFGDSRRNPYGERPREEIVRFAGEIRDFLLARQVKAVVMPVIGMSTDFSSLPPVRKAAVFATPASIAAHAHRRAMKAALPGAEIIEVPCEGLAHAIETCAPREAILAIVAAAIEKFGASGTRWRRSGRQTRRAGRAGEMSFISLPNGRMRKSWRKKYLAKPCRCGWRSCKEL